MATILEELWHIGGMKLTLRRLESSDLGQLITLIENECWPVSLEELIIVHQLAPNGFLGVFSDDGVLICHVSLVYLNDFYGHGTLYLTSKHYRGRGVGKRLFNYAVEVSKPRTISLDAVFSRVNTYELSGLKQCGVELRWLEGTSNRQYLAGNTSDDPAVVIHQLTSKDINAVCVYDRNISGCDRGDFLKLYFDSPRNQTVAAKDPVTNEPRGYLIMRADFTNYTGVPRYQCVGFYADTASIAAQLLRTMFLKHIPSDIAFWFQYPSANGKSALKVFQLLGKTRHNEAMRLPKMTCRGTLPEFHWENVYCVVNCFTGFGFI